MHQEVSRERSFLTRERLSFRAVFQYAGCATPSWLETAVNVADRKTILLVEDNAAIAMKEKALLEKSGYSVLFACSGEEAIAVSGSEPGIDLVLMDVELGRGMDGPGAARGILAMRDVPLLFVFSGAEPGILERIDGIASYGCVVRDSGETALLSSVGSALRLFEAKKYYKKKAEESARDQSKKYRNIFQASTMALELYDAEGHLLEVNDACLRLFGIPDPEQMRGFSIFRGPDVTDDMKREIREGRVSHHAVQFDFDLVKKQGLFETSREGIIHIDVTVSPLGDGGDRYGYLVQVQDVTDHWQAEEDLKFSEEKFLRSFMMSPAGICIARLKDFTLIDVNNTFLEKSGFTREDVIGKAAPELMVWDNPENRREAVAALLTEGKISGKEYAFRMKDGSVIISEYAACIITIGGEKHILVSIVDITARKKAEERITALLAEKELLLKEVHHRIKNNMSTIMSLLALQAGRVGSGEAAGALQDAVGRVRSMGVLYDKLYHSATLREMPIDAYLAPLVDEIVAMFPGSGGVTVEKQLGDFALGVKVLSPLGIIVNELVTNAMKYAFSGGQGGTLRVTASKEGPIVTVAIEDSGPGLPEGFGMAHSAGFGLELVSILAKQIGGKVRAEKGKGTRFVLEFNAGSGPAPGNAVAQMNPR
jgi:two-component system, sensor histidine kinase PdtaS